MSSVSHGESHSLVVLRSSSFRLLTTQCKPMLRWSLHPELDALRCVANPDRDLSRRAFRAFFAIRACVRAQTRRRFRAFQPKQLARLSWALGAWHEQGIDLPGAGGFAARVLTEAGQHPRDYSPEELAQVRMDDRQGDSIFRVIQEVVASHQLFIPCGARAPSVMEAVLSSPSLQTIMRTICKSIVVMFIHC